MSKSVAVNLDFPGVVGVIARPGLVLSVSKLPNPSSLETMSEGIFIDLERVEGERVNWVRFDCVFVNGARVDGINVVFLRVVSFKFSRLISDFLENCQEICEVFEALRDLGVLIGLGGNGVSKGKF